MDHSSKENRSWDQSLRDLTELYSLNDEAVHVARNPWRYEPVKGPPKRHLKHFLKYLFNLILTPMMRVHLNRQLRMNHLLIHTAARASVLEAQVRELQAELARRAP